jgi:hypothetical protein
MKLANRTSRFASRPVRNARTKSFWPVESVRVTLTRNLVQQLTEFIAEEDAKYVMAGETYF